MVHIDTPAAVRWTSVKARKISIIGVLVSVVFSVVIEEGVRVIETFKYAGAPIWFLFWLERIVIYGGGGLACIYLPAGVSAALAWVLRHPSPRRWFDAITMLFFVLYLVALVGKWGCAGICLTSSENLPEHRGGLDQKFAEFIWDHAEEVFYLDLQFTNTDNQGDSVIFDRAIGK